MYHVETIDIKKGMPEFAYLDYACHCANNMYNVANFYIRNLMTGLQKSPKERTPNEEEVIRTVEESIPHINESLLAKHKQKIQRIKNNSTLSEKEKQSKIAKAKCIQFSMPTSEKWFASYELLDAVFRYTENKDYKAQHSHLVQTAIKGCVGAWLSFFEQQKEGNGLGRKHHPGYKKSGGCTTAVFSNLACFIKHGMLLFPQATLPTDSRKRRIGLCVSKLPHASGDKLIEVRVVPYFGSYQIQIVTDDGVKEEDILPKEEDMFAGDTVPGVMMLDMGVHNFAAITDNKGNTPIVIKGGAVKARNQWYNKKMAFLKSEQMKGTNKKKYQPTKRMLALSRKRDAFIKDTFYKYAHLICRLIVERNLSYLIVGHNDGQKQNTNMGHRNNQSFVYIPFARFNSILVTVARKYGIRVLFQEESYTSKACFVAKDPLPIYGEEDPDKEQQFSGKRTKRGLYRQNDGKVLNADINGSANIGRKYDERVFADVKDFSFLYGTVTSISFADICKPTEKKEPKSNSRRAKKHRRKHKHKNKQVVSVKRDSGRVSARCSGNRTEAPASKHVSA